MTYDFIIVGGGVFGVSTSIELARSGHSVLLVEAGRIPNPLAASSDINKAVRVEYGSDKEYFRMAQNCIDKWKEWNEIFGEIVYHEVGFLMLSKHDLSVNVDSYEAHSLAQLHEADYIPERYASSQIEHRFPAIKAGVYEEAVYNQNGGFVASGRAVELLSDYAISIGVEVIEEQPVLEILTEANRATGVRVTSGPTYKGGHIIIAAGAHTPYLLPRLAPYMRSTGHPVFWLKPSDPQSFKDPLLPVFMADIANTGWYGFPYSSDKGIIKIAKHASGIPVHPDHDERVVYESDIVDMRSFVSESLPGLQDAELIYTRRCLYTDSLDGHFWITPHPDLNNLTISSGGSGHGMKMGPEVGVMTAAIAEGSNHNYSNRYLWRHLTEDMEGKEECRLVD